MRDGRRVIVIGPQFGGSDGLSELGRQVVAAVAADAADAVVVYSLQDRGHPELLRRMPVQFCSSDGNRLRFVAAILGETLRVSPGDLIVVLHAHFLPLSLPLIARGAALAAVLVGVESWRPLTMLQRAALSKAAHVVAISRHTVERFTAANPSLAHADLIVCHPSVPATADAGGSLVMPGFALIVGRMSREERYKGHDALLEAWPRVRASCPDARLVIVGEGDDRGRLQEKARLLGLDDATLFLGRVGDARLNGLYREAAFFVMPSRDEGFGFVYLEAMRAGRPCIACPGAASEILEDGRSGVLVTFGSVAELEAACVRLFSDPDLCSRLGRAGAEAVRQRFLAGHFVDRFRSALGLAQFGTNLPGSLRGPDGPARHRDQSVPHDDASSVPWGWS
jgi:glycosyltransferase involved in cell wall biosynthesis